jgi:hypothetical protein
MKSSGHPERNLPKLNAKTLDFISHGFAHTNGREMTMADLKAMSLSDAKGHIATAKHLASRQAVKTDQSFLHALEKEHAKRKLRNRCLAASGAAIIVLLALFGSLGGAEPAKSHQEPRNISTAKPAAASDDEPQVKGTATTTIGEGMLDSVPTPPPAAQTTAPAPKPVTPPTQKPVVNVFQDIPPPAPAPIAEDCDPNYSGGCVPNVSYNLDCADIGFTVQIIGIDRHGFDGNDNDGFGCESY